MEDSIAYAIMILVPVVVFFMVRAGARYFERRQQALDQAEMQRIEELAAIERTRIRNRMKEIEDFKARPSTTRVETKPATLSTPSYAPAPTQAVNTWSNDPLTTMIITDMLLNHKDVSAGTVTWKDDTPTIKETYSKPSTPSFGFDDNDSRQSASSSFSSSDSSSSWSSSGSSSSSDSSGPSSDW